MTREEAFRTLRDAFAQAGLDTPTRDAQLLVHAGLGLDRAALLTGAEVPVSAAEAALLEGYGRRRLAREPVARILGEWEFWGLPFALSADTLVPRPETETLVETALDLAPDPQAPLRILDLGTGSGCILVALLHERPRALGIGADLSEGALGTASRNARRNGVAGRSLFVASRWGEAVQGPLDLIVSNPPYIAAPVIETLDPEVRDYDPSLALDGGPDGLAAYRAILADAPRLLRPGGHLLLEVGYDQAEAVLRLNPGLPLAIVRIAPDLSGTPRCVALKRT